jgi:hypothetical protein
VVAVGFCMALFEKLAFSIFILGALVIGSVVSIQHYTIIKLALSITEINMNYTENMNFRKDELQKISNSGKMTHANLLAWFKQLKITGSPDK